MLPFASWAVIVMLKVLSAVCGSLMVLKVKWSRTFGLTVKVLLIQDWPPPLVEM